MDVAARVDVVGVRRVVVMTVALLAALAGCSDELERPPSLPPLTATPSASPGTQGTPTGINAPTPDGATEFARYFYGQVSEGFRTRDASLVSRLSLPSCSTCANYVRSISTVSQRELTVEGGEFDLFVAVATAQSDPALARIDVAWNFQTAVYRNAAGEVVDSSPAVMGVEEQVDLVRAEGVWRVSAITRLRQQS